MYVKVFGTILDSSIWLEDHATVRLWLTMLVSADESGFVRGLPPLLASKARVTDEECEVALETLRSPDPLSGTPDHEGRRIEDVDGGWMLLNYEKYREMRTRAQVLNAERQERYRKAHSKDGKKKVASED